MPTSVALAQAGHALVVVDNLANAKLSVLERLQALAGKEIPFVQADVRDGAALEAVFKSHRFEAVLHFAGLKSVGGSVANPALYHEVNVGGTRTLLEAMRRHGVRRIVFSSSATVYGVPEFLPYTEDHPLRPTNPYGETKLAVERLLAAEAGARPGFACACLRYFNPIGAHPSGRIGEDPRGLPENLLPYVAQVAVGLRPALRFLFPETGRSRSTSARGAGTRCWRWCGPSRRQAERASRSTSGRGGRGILLRTTPTLR